MSALALHRDTAIYRLSMAGLEATGKANAVASDGHLQVRRRHRVFLSLTASKDDGGDQIYYTQSDANVGVERETFVLLASIVDSTELTQVHLAW